MKNPIVLVILISLLALCLAFLVYHPILRYAQKHGIYDNPGERKLQRRPIPVLGGYVVTIAALVAVQVGWLYYDCTGLLATEFAMLLMLALGMVDDRRCLSPTFRLIVEIVVATGMMLGNGYVIDNFHGLWGIYEIPSCIAWPLSVFAVIGIINAINLIDGVNGLCSGMCLLAVGFFSIKLFCIQHYDVAILGMAVFGALIPFFIYNVFGNNSKMFLGDGGTLMMGILLSDMVIRIMSSDYTSGDRFGAVAFVLAVLAIPIGDTLRVMFVRISKHKSPFQPDRTHLHHAFINYGFTHLETALIEIIMDAGIVGVWWLLYKSDTPVDWQFYAVVIVSFVAIVGMFRLLHRKERIAAKSASRNLGR